MLTLSSEFLQNLTALLHWQGLIKVIWNWKLPHQDEHHAKYKFRMRLGMKSQFKKYKLDNKIKKEHIFLTNRHNLWIETVNWLVCSIRCFWFFSNKGQKHQRKYIITCTIFNASKKHLNLLSFNACHPFKSQLKY